MRVIRRRTCRYKSISLATHHDSSSGQKMFGECGKNQSGRRPVTDLERRLEWVRRTARTCGGAVRRRAYSKLGWVVRHHRSSARCRTANRSPCPQPTQPSQRQNQHRAAASVCRARTSSSAASDSGSRLPCSGVRPVHGPDCHFVIRSAQLRRGCGTASAVRDLAARRRNLAPARRLGV